jgi:hypothetical protein
MAGNRLSRKPFTRIGVLAVVALATVALATPGSARPAGAAMADPTCSAKLATVAHHAGGHVVAQRTPARVACASETGFYTGETGIAVSGNGTVWFSAANWESALARSDDNGHTWKAQTPAGPQAMPGCEAVTSPWTCDDSESSKNNTVADAYLYVDPKTSKLFWSKTFGLAVCSSLSMTPDDGRSWQANTRFGCPGGDYEKIAAGPAPAGGAQPVGYPNVVYGCTNGPIPFFVVGPARVCYKSLDGGKSFSSTGAPVTPSPLAPGCLQFQEAQTVGPDGTLYVPLNCVDNPTGVRVRVAVSTDEGTTWSYPAVPTGEAGNAAGAIGGGVSMAVDKAGVVYVVWRGNDNRAYLAVSKDKGTTWKGPMMVTMPGVTTALGPMPQVAAREPGHIAIGYYGVTKDASRVSGYLTESFDAASSSPLFHSTAVNDSKHPLYFPTDGGSLPRNDYLGVTIGPDGTPWIGLVKLKNGKSDSQGFIQSTGYVGRLVRP